MVLKPSGIEIVHVKTCLCVVAAAGTAVPLEAGVPEFYKVLSITIRAYEGNTGDVYVGDSNRVTNADYHYRLAQGESISLDAGQNSLRQDRYLDLTQIWLNADNNDDGICYIALIDTEPW